MKWSRRVTTSRWWSVVSAITLAGSLASAANTTAQPHSVPQDVTPLGTLNLPVQRADMLAGTFQVEDTIISFRTQVVDSDIAVVHLEADGHPFDLRFDRRAREARLDGHGGSISPNAKLALAALEIALEEKIAAGEIQRGFREDRLLALVRLLSEPPAGYPIPTMEKIVPEPPRQDDRWKVYPRKQGRAPGEAADESQAEAGGNAVPCMDEDYNRQKSHILVRVTFTRANKSPMALCAAYASYLAVSLGLRADDSRLAETGFLVLAGFRVARQNIARSTSSAWLWRLQPSTLYLRYCVPV